MGPILFTNFVNDLAETINGCEIVQYVNNTQIMHMSKVDASPDLNSTAQTTFSQTSEYFSKNGLMLNADKTQYVFITTRVII